MDAAAARGREEAAEESAEPGDERVGETRAGDPDRGSGDEFLRVGVGVVVDHRSDDEDIEDAGKSTGGDRGEEAFVGIASGEESAEEDNDKHAQNGGLAGGIHERHPTDVGGKPGGGGDAEGGGEEFRHFRCL